MLLTRLCRSCSIRKWIPAHETERKRTEQSFFVDADEIRENDFDLSINKYKEIVYEPVEYDPPEVILDRIDELEKEIQDNMTELRKLLNSDL